MFRYRADAGALHGQERDGHIQKITLQMPETNFEASGVLGVNEGDRLTGLRVDMTVRDLSEYNQLLTDAGLGGEWKER